MPIGALDQHGPHLPLGTNVLIARRLALDLSTEFRVLRAPTFYYGVSIETKELYAGTTTLRQKTFHLALNDILAGWETHGVEELILITAHRYEPHIQAIATLYPTGATIRVVQAWDAPIDDLLEVQETALRAGEAETSVLLHLYPDLVRLERATDHPIEMKEFQRYLDGRSDPPLIEAGGGTIGWPSAASAEKGAAIYSRILDSIRRSIFLEPRDSYSDSL